MKLIQLVDDLTAILRERGTDIEVWFVEWCKADGGIHQTVTNILRPIDDGEFVEVDDTILKPVVYINLEEE